MFFTSACLPKRELIGLLISLKLVLEFLEGAAITAAGTTESFCKTDAPLYDLLEVIIKLKAISVLLHHRSLVRSTLTSHLTRMNSCCLC